MPSKREGLGDARPDQPSPPWNAMRFVRQSRRGQMDRRPWIAVLRVVQRTLQPRTVLAPDSVGERAERAQRRAAVGRSFLLFHTDGPAADGRPGPTR